MIIDTPPLGSVVDAAVISQYCDGAILVIESGSTSYRVVQKVKAQLEKSGCKILGAVLNKMEYKGRGYRVGYRAGYGRKGARTPYGEIATYEKK